MNKIKILNNYNDLNNIRFKNLKKKIGLCHGAFDIVHLGHLRHLIEAKKKVDILVVSITSDAFIKKGPNQPHNKELARLEYLSHFEFIDFLFLDKNLTSVNVLKNLKPNFYFKGLDYKKKDITGNFLKELSILKKNNGKLKITSTHLMSSTKILNNIIHSWKPEQISKLNFVNNNYNFEKIYKIINDLSKISLTLIGEPIIDKYIFCDLIGVTSKSPSMSFLQKNIQQFDGGVLAVAKILSLFVKKIDLLTYGNQKILSSSFREYKNIKINSLEKKMDIQTKTRIINANRSEKIIQLTNYKDYSFSKLQTKKIHNKLKKINFKNTIICDYGINFFENSILSFIESLRVKKYLNVQTNSINYGNNLFTKYNNFHYLCLDENEWRLGLHKKTLDPVLVKKISNYNKNKFYALTLGKNGSILYKNGVEYKSPVFEDRVIDTTGCGDAYFALSSMLLMTLKPNDRNLIPFLSNIYAGMHSLHIGNKVTTSKNEYLKYLKSLLNF